MLFFSTKHKPVSVHFKGVLGPSPLWAGNRS